MHNPIYIYMHICCINNWEDIVGNIIDKIRQSGLYNQVLEIRCTILGDPMDSIIFKDPKICIIHHSFEYDIGESVTLNIMREQAAYMSPDTNILYLHSKGVRTNGQNPCIEDWTKYMTYFVVERWEECQIALDIYDTVGVNLSQEVAWHYSGNFWWAKAAYIFTLGKCSREPYLAPEMWVCSKTENRGCIFQSDRNHYLQRFPENLYRIFDDTMI